MKKIMILIAAVGLAPLCWADQSKQDVDERLTKAAEVLHQVMATPDKGIPQEVVDHAKCIAVVPHLVKGGFVFGAEGGRGAATCRTAHGWSAPAFFDVEGGSWGLQIGVEGIDLVMIIQNDKGMQDLLSSKFQIGADASAAAGPVGRHASADTDWKMNA
jgi:SH3 domain-containing YSC84-like protein 1